MWVHCHQHSLSLVHVVSSTFSTSIVCEYNRDRYLSYTDYELSLFLWLLCMLDLPYACYGTRARDRLYWCATKTLCASPFNRAEEVFPSYPSSLSFVPFSGTGFVLLWWRKLWYMNGCYSGFRPSMARRRRRESWETWRDLTPICTLNVIFWNTETCPMCQLCHLVQYNTPCHFCALKSCCFKTFDMHIFTADFLLGFI